MYLSRIELNPNKRETMRAFASPQILHGAVERCFEGERQRNLWRIDWLAGKCYLLILSAEKPDFSNLAMQFGYPDAQDTWQTKDYAPILEKLSAGQQWRFRLRANPVRSSMQGREAGARGKVYAHVTQEQQKQWLLARAPAYGVMLKEDAFDVTHTQWVKFRKGTDGGRKVTLRTAIFEGTLTVTDPTRFTEALLRGIGRGKAYGCGLMTIMRCGGEKDG